MKRTESMKKALVWFLLLLMTAGMLSCSGENAEDTAPAAESSCIETEAAGWDGKLVISADSDFIYMRDDDARDAETNAVITFKKLLSEKLGTEFAIKTDWEKNAPEVIENTDREILLGRTNRKESAELLEQIGSNGYGMTVTENKLVITATDTSNFVLALERFEKDILENSEKCKDGVLTVSTEDSFIVKSDKALSLADIIESGLKYEVSLELAVACSRIDEYYVGQGAASDGTYVYFVLRTSADGYARIAKYELATGKFVAASEPVYVYHGNDMTYCKSSNMLVLVHGSSEGKILTLMDADTLTVTKQTQNIGAGAGAISYSWAKDMFAFSQGGSTLYFMNSDFTGLSANHPRSSKSDYTSQGMGSDEKYIYFPMSGSADNILAVYDWDGKYVTDVHLPTTLESESMFWVNDTYYVNFHRAGVGPALYRIDVSLKY